MRISFLGVDPPPVDSLLLFLLQAGAAMSFMCQIRNWLGMGIEFSLFKGLHKSISLGRQGTEGDLRCTKL